MLYKILTVLVLAAAPIACWGQDSFSFNRLEYNFDTLYVGETTGAVFLLKNTGKNILFIHAVSKSPSSLFYSSAPLYPGNCTMITFMFSAVKTGDIKEDILVSIATEKELESGEAKSVVLKLKGVVDKGARPQSILTFSANEYNVGNVKGENSLYYKIDFRNEGSTGLRIDDIRFEGIPLLYSAGYYHSCSNRERKPMVGAYEIIRKGEKGAILLKLDKNELKEGAYETEFIVQGNFDAQRIKVKFSVAR